MEREFARAGKGDFPLAQFFLNLRKLVHFQTLFSDFIESTDKFCQLSNFNNIEKAGKENQVRGNGKGIWEIKRGGMVWFVGKKIKRKRG